MNLKKRNLRSVDSLHGNDKPWPLNKFSMSLEGLETRIGSIQIRFTGRDLCLLLDPVVQITIEGPRFGICVADTSVRGATRLQQT